MLESLSAEKSGYDEIIFYEVLIGSNGNVEI
jgi:hypothetical protein